MMPGNPSRVVDSAAAYDRYAPGYDSLLSENRINAHMRRAMMAFERATFRPGQRLLEVGCGTGDEAIALAVLGCDVVGMDPSSEMIRIARAKAAAAPLRGTVRFVAGYARDLDTALGDEDDASFDGGYSSFALSYEKGLDGVRDGLSRLLRPGGVFLASAMNRLSGAEWVLSLASIHPSLSGRRLEASTPHKVGSVRTNVYCRTASELARGFAPGFQVINLRGLPVVLPPPYANRPLLRWPTLITALGRLDAHVGGWPILRYLGDHNVVWLRRSGGPPR
ncbi:MAG TPA: methyltransferase domain-containing protein [Thermoplasmata archaeon]|nr:methyltransferase domain-containing protein [Thermoplasmata archaeon]